jgi:hypothetical protein
MPASRLSKNGGMYPTWCRDGKEIFFRTRKGLLFNYSTPFNGESYSASRDGQQRADQK